MAYTKVATSRAAYITPSDSHDIYVTGAFEATGAGSSISVGGGGEVNTADLTVFGNGYTTHPTITDNTATGSGAVLEPIMGVNGEITGITVVDPGTLYDAADTLTVSGGVIPNAQPCILYIGAAAAEITVTTDGGDIIKFLGVPAGVILGGASPINVRKVWNTGTSASLDTEGALIGLW